MIFIDTGAFVARYFSHDQYHQRAVEIWSRIAANGENCITSNFILDETFTLLARRAGYEFAFQRARNIYASHALKIIRPEEKEELSALNFFNKYADQAVSFTDCISFAIMKREKINRAFSFDRHFQFAGFNLIP
jgi:predicted nucleic acid-binding protein